MLLVFCQVNCDVISYKMEKSPLFVKSRDILGLQIVLGKKLSPDKKLSQDKKFIWGRKIIPG